MFLFFFFLEYLQENEPLCCGPVNIHISFSPFIRGLMRINVCWIESVTPRLDTQGDWTGISSLKRSARIQTAASGSSALCISNRTKWGEMASLWTFSVETHQKSEQETCFPTRVKCRRVSPASAFWADVGLASPCVCLCFGENVLERDLVLLFESDALSLAGIA